MDPILEFPTREAAEAAANADLVARRSSYPNYGGKRFVLATVDDYDGHGETTVEAEEVNGEPGIGTVLAWHVTDETGMQMLGTDGEWYFVA